MKLCGDRAKFSTCSNFFIFSFSLLVLAPRGKFTINLFTHKPIVHVYKPIVHVIYAVLMYMYLDNHTLAVIKMSESHDILAEALGPLFEEIKLLMEK